MGLRLPSYQELSREQDEINNLPLRGRRLVIGPPGTGKTVMALYRSSMFEKQERYSRFFVYNRTLRFYLDQAIRETGLNGAAEGFHRWFGNWYQSTFRKRAPQVRPYVFDWDAVIEDLTRYQGEFRKFDHLAIDEGQDLPRQFYFVARLMADNLTVFADENQMINETETTLRELQTMLDPDSVHVLIRNYRNTRQIAEFASSFYVGLASGIPELPMRTGRKPRLLRNRSMKEQIGFVRTYEHNFPDQDIGVLVYRQADVRRFVRELQGTTRNTVQWYVSGGHAPEIDFGTRGIRVLTYASAKGLEFDTVILPQLDQVRPAGGLDEVWKMKFYVLASRPREHLIMLQSGESLPQILAHVDASLYDVSG